MTKKELINQIRETIHNNFDLLWNNMSEDENILFFLDCKQIYNLRYKTKKEIIRKKYLLNLLITMLKCEEQK